MAKRSNVSTKVENTSKALPYVKLLYYGMHDCNSHFISVPSVLSTKFPLKNTEYTVCEYSTFIFNDNAVGENAGFLSYTTTKSTLHFCSS